MIFSKDEHLLQQDIPEIVQRFRNNNPNIKFDNAYLCEIIDINDNIIDTKIGVNLMTNYGLEQIWTKGVSNRPSMYLGSGTDEPSPENKTLNSYISDLGAGTIVSNEKIYYPTNYDKDTHIWSVDTQIQQSMWDYMAGSNKEYDIYEIGIGADQNNLFTHALIYDELGNQTSIKKKPNTRLYISLLWTTSINIEIIQKRFDEGKYLYINPTALNMLVRDYNKYIRMFPITRGESYTINEGSMTYEAIGIHEFDGKIQDDPRDVKFTIEVPENNAYIWNDRYYYCSGILVSNSITSYSDSRLQYLNLSVGTFGILSYDKMNDPEVIESYYVFTDGISQILTNINDDSKNDNLYTLSQIFGSHQRYKMEDGVNWKYNDGIPCTDYSISEINMYNHLSKSYDIPVNFHTSDWDYNCMHWRVYLPLWVKYNNIAQNVYVYINANVDRKISGFNNTNIIICATDEYWDPDTYIQIPNITNVPEELSNKRYYIVTSGTNAELLPVFVNTDYHKIIPKNQTFDFSDEKHNVPIVKQQFSGYSILNMEYYTFYRGAYKPNCSNEKSWYANSDYIVFYDKSSDSCVVKSIMYDDVNKRCCTHRRFKTSNGDKLICFESTIGSPYNVLNVKNNIRIFTITDKDTNLSYQDITLTFDDQTDLNSTKDCHHLSWSENGFLVAQRPLFDQPHEAVVVDVYGDDESNNSATQYLLKNVFGCTAILLTNNCFYMDTNESIGTKYVFKLYDMKNKSVLKRYEIDDGVNYDIKFTYGFREFIYVTVYYNSTTSTIFFNTQTDSIEHLIAYVPSLEYSSWETSCNIVAINECMILCHPDNNARIITADNPNPTGENFQTVCAETVNTLVRRGYYPSIGTCNDGKQLILTYSYDDQLNTVDLGLILDNGPIQYHPYVHNSGKYPLSRDSGYQSCSMVFNDGIVWSSDGLYYNREEIKSAYTNGRQSYIPIECILPLHMKGTTRTLSAYNQPIKWWGKTCSFDITNDMSKLTSKETSEVVE